MLFIYNRIFFINKNKKKKGIPLIFIFKIHFIKHYYKKYKSYIYI